MYPSLGTKLFVEFSIFKTQCIHICTSTLYEQTHICYLFKCNTLPHYKHVVIVLLAHVVCVVAVGGFSITLKVYRGEG